MIALSKMGFFISTSNIFPIRLFFINTFCQCLCIFQIQRSIFSSFPFSTEACYFRCSLSSPSRFLWLSFRWSLRLFVQYINSFIYTIYLFVSHSVVSHFMVDLIYRYTLSLAGCMGSLNTRVHMHFIFLCSLSRCVLFSTTPFQRFVLLHSLFLTPFSLSYFCYSFRLFCFNFEFVILSFFTSCRPCKRTMTTTRSTKRGFYVDFVSSDLLTFKLLLCLRIHLLVTKIKCKYLISSANLTL